MSTNPSAPITPVDYLPVISTQLRLHLISAFPSLEALKWTERSQCGGHEIVREVKSERVLASGRLDSEDWENSLVGVVEVWVVEYERIVG